MSLLPLPSPPRPAVMITAILLSFLTCVCLVASSLFSVESQPQVPVMVEDGAVDLIHELKKAEIIPTVFDEFQPLLTISVEWKNGTADYGNTLRPTQTKQQPDVEFINTIPSSWDLHKHPQLTIAMTDPDAPSRDNPEWSEICHWICTDIKLKSAFEEHQDDEDEDDHEDDDHPDDEEHDEDHDQKSSASRKKRMMDIMPFKPPGPPPKTGKHRYVFVALAPKNGTTNALHLRKPDDRQHWGFKHERDGLKMWAEEMGLEVVGANFIYAQNDEQ